jgi:hypothetical protein
MLVLSSASAGELSIRRFQLPGHGALVMAVPDAWQEQIEQLPNGLASTLKFVAKSGPAFEVLVTPVWVKAGKAAARDPAYIRKKIESMAAVAKPQAVEKALEIKTLKGGSGVGYYFSATDRMHGPGGYRHLTRGILPVGELTVVFTILTNDGSDTTVNAALLLLQDATQGKADAT